MAPLENGISMDACKSKKVGERGGMGSLIKKEKEVWRARCN